MGKHPGGRPTHYTEELGQFIADTIACSPLSLKKLCEKHSEFPANESTIFQWINKHPWFKQKYLEAREQQMNVNVEMLNDQMDDDLIYYFDEKGNKRIDSPSVTIAMAKANNKKWAASKFAPKRFGDKLGGDEKLNKLCEKIIEKIIDSK